MAKPVIHNASRGNTSRSAKWLEGKDKERLLGKARNLGINIPNEKKVTKAQLVEMLRTD